MAAPIRALDPHTVTLLRAGVYLHSLSHALKTLLQVSLRSTPTSIATSIDPRSGTLSVDDNGIGIDKRLVNLLGRFDPKSCQNHQDDNQFLSYLLPSQHRVLDSLAHLSLLDICSRQSDSSYTHQTLFKEGQIIFSAPAKTSRRHNRGTTVTVRNLFYNLPVRQIQDTDQNRLQQRLKRQWNEARIIIQSLAIINPHVTFTLRNSAAHHHTQTLSDQSSFYQISKTGSSISTFGKVFGQQFVQESITLDSSFDSFHVKGLFSKSRHASRSIQLIYLDQVLITQDSVLHKTLANLFARSVSQDVSTLPEEHGWASTQMSYSSKGVTSTVDRYPVYLILFTSTHNQNPSNKCFQQQQSDDHNHFFDDKQEELIPQIEEKLKKIICQVFSQAFSSIPDNDREIHHTCCSSKGDCDRGTSNVHLDQNTLDFRWPVVKRARFCNNSVLINEPLRSCSPHVNTEDCFVETETNTINPDSFKHQSENKSLSSGSKFNHEFAEEINHQGKNHTSPATESLQLGSVKKVRDLKSRFQYNHPTRSITRTISHPNLVRAKTQVHRPEINHHHALHSHRSSLSHSKTKCVAKNPIGSTKRSSSGPTKLIFESPELNPTFDKFLQPVLDLSNLRSRFEYKPPPRGSKYRCISDPQKPAYRGGSGQVGDQLNLTIEDHHHTEILQVDLSKFSHSSKFTVIGQLDLKFIIVNIHNRADGHDDMGQGGLIVAFDQHAVHERIRIEKFLKLICTRNHTPKKLSLHKTHASNHPQRDKHREENAIKDLRAGQTDDDLVPVLVTRIEFEGLLKFKKHFERWGLFYEIKENTQGKPSAQCEDQEVEPEEFQQIYMVAVPELIWDKVHSDGFKLLKTILKGCLGFFEDRGRDGSLDHHHHLLSSGEHLVAGSVLESDPRGWFRFVKDCPTVLIDLLNSKACRGSIMFGDRLEDSESARLIVQLSRTNLPFSCAHGRPTCFPLFKFDPTPSDRKPISLSAARPGPKNGSMDDFNSKKQINWELLFSD